LIRFQVFGELLQEFLWCEIDRRDLVLPHHFEEGLYAIDDQILRLTYTYKQDPHIPLAYLSVVARVVVRGKVVELHRYIGEVMVGPILHEGSNRVKTKAEIIRASIEDKAREPQLEVRAGIFDP